MSAKKQYAYRFVFAACVWTFVVLIPGVMWAQGVGFQPGAENDSASQNTGRPSRWAGSSVTLTNLVSTLSFKKDAEPFYNPTNTISVNGRLQWRWSKHLCTSLAFGLSRETTTPDIRTHVDDVWLTDTLVGLCLLRLNVPKTSTSFTLDWISYLPTSPFSRGASLIYGGEAQIGVNQGFDTFWRPTIGYRVGLRANAHHYTTRQTETPSIAACQGMECAQLSHTGSRNARFQQNHSVFFMVQPTNALTVSANVAVFLSHLYALTDVERVLVQTGPDTPTRYAMNYGISLDYTVSPGVAAGLFVSTFNPQQAPGSQYYRPFFNRFSQVAVFVRLMPPQWFQ